MAFYRARAARKAYSEPLRLPVFLPQTVVRHLIPILSSLWAEAYLFCYLSFSYCLTVSHSYIMNVRSFLSHTRRPILLLVCRGKHTPMSHAALHLLSFSATYGQPALSLSPSDYEKAAFYIFPTVIILLL